MSTTKKKSLSDRIVSAKTKNSFSRFDPEDAPLTKHITKKQDLFDNDDQNQFDQNDLAPPAIGKSLRGIDSNFGESYRAKKSSRGQIFDELQDSDENEENYDDENESYDDEGEESYDDEQNQESDQSSDDSSQDNKDSMLKSKEMEEAAKMLKELQNDEEEQMAAIKRVQQTESEKETAIQVQSQIKTWKSILETRIRFQKPLTFANRFPPPDCMKLVKQADPTIKALFSEALDESVRLLDDLIDLKETLLEQSNPKYTTKKRKVETTEQYWDILQDIEKSYQPELENILTDWNSRVNLISGKKFSQKNLQALSRPILAQISDFLSDKVLLRRRTQLNRNELDIFGVKSKEEYNPEIFDDSDFYQTLLTDLLSESKKVNATAWKQKTATTSSGSQVNFQNINLDQFKKIKKKKMMKSKMVSHDVIDELVGFVAPVDEPNLRDWGSALTESLFKD